ncbi:hypothetical protein LSTR_LSTR010492 [Laodelphax striatellus]|uniref:Uncharacterized protein n=1 Tax=Laodelphax striatellus TaxID=195883 RepID=A0A482X662_LAOST|nr:hypothetical protein LSTR_LSTR010492 [Laodelphax striatellus]
MSVSLRSTSQQHRPQLDRAVSMNIDDRCYKSSSKLANPSLIGRWRSFRMKQPPPNGLPPTSSTWETLLPPRRTWASSRACDNSIPDELSVKICKDSIRQSILDQMKISSGDVKLLLTLKVVKPPPKP